MSEEHQFIDFFLGGGSVYVLHLFQDQISISLK